jgi:hypothetical protein
VEVFVSRALLTWPDIACPVAALGFASFCPAEAVA